MNNTSGDSGAAERRDAYQRLRELRGTQKQATPAPRRRWPVAAGKTNGGVSGAVERASLVSNAENPKR